MEVFLSKYLLIIYIALLILVLFILLFYWNKKKKEKKELSSIAQYKVREHILDQTLHNPYHERQPDKKQEFQTPYHVDYENKSVCKKQLNTHAMIQIAERGDFSVKKYILDPMSPILIGKKRDGNTIVAADEDIAPVQCEIFPHENKLYLRDMLSGTQTSLIRGKTTHHVNEQGVGIRNKDIILAGKTKFEITIIK